MTQFDIQQLVTTAHGHLAQTYPLVGLKRFTPDFAKIGKSVFGRTQLGRPYFMDLIINGHQLPNEPLVTISSRKRIVQTAIAGTDRRGTVKELIASEDYTIKIEGVCIEPESKTYPEQQVAGLIALCETPAALDVDNDLMNLFGIHRLVITSYAFDKMQGTPHAQRYVINAVSDEDFYGNLKHQL